MAERRGGGFRVGLLVLCFNWQDPVQDSTPMPQWPKSIFYGYFFYRAVLQCMRSLLRETGEPVLECAEGPGLSHH